MKNIFVKIGLFLEMIKFEHSIFALPFAYLGLLMAAGKWPSIFVFFWITVAMVSFRTMAMGLNRLLDLRIDAANPRTEGRALPQKKLRVSLVWGLVLLSFLVFEGSAYRLGALCFLLSPVPVVLAVVYPFTKRFTWFSHFVLGLVLGIAPYGAWIAVTGHFAWVPAFLSGGVLCWVAGFDMIYALQDAEFDRSYGLYSVPAKFGTARTMQWTQVLHVAAVLCWAVAGYLNSAGWLYGIGLVLASCLLIREHSVIRSFGAAKMNEAFFILNAVISVTLLLAVVLDIAFKS
ncbi:MAG: UbiA-like polyprenyltransferase [Candidatus Omnitrophota bacterium]